MLTADHVGNLRKLVDDEKKRELHYLKRLRDQITQDGASAKALYETTSPILDTIMQIEHTLQHGVIGIHIGGKA